MKIVKIIKKQKINKEKIDLKSQIEKKREIRKDKKAIHQMMFIMIKNKMLTQMINNNIYQSTLIK